MMMYDIHLDVVLVWCPEICYSLWPKRGHTEVGEWWDVIETQNTFAESHTNSCLNCLREFVFRSCRLFHLPKVHWCWQCHCHEYTQMVTRPPTSGASFLQNHTTVLTPWDTNPCWGPKGWRCCACFFCVFWNEVNQERPMFNPAHILFLCLLVRLMWVDSRARAEHSCVACIGFTFVSRYSAVALICDVFLTIFSFQILCDAGSAVSWLAIVVVCVVVVCSRPVPLRSAVPSTHRPPAHSTGWSPGSGVIAPSPLDRCVSAFALRCTIAPTCLIPSVARNQTLLALWCSVSNLACFLVQ